MTRAERGIAFFVFTAAISAGVSSCAPTIYQPPSPYTPEEQAAIDRARRGAAADHQAKEQLELEEACSRARELAGEIAEYENPDGTIASGVKVFPTGCFAGKFKSTVGAFTKQGLTVLDQGVYVTSSRSAMRGAVFAGKFLYLSEKTPGNYKEKGTTIMIGKRSESDGKETVGIFVAEGARPPDYPAGQRLVLADKRYLEQIEKKHEEQVAAFNEEQRRKTQSKREGFNFGQAIALGLGGAVIAGTGVNAGLPAEDILRVAAAFTTDVMTEGEAGAMDALLKEQETELNASAGDNEDGSSGGESFEMTCDARPRHKICVEYTFDNKADFEAFKPGCKAKYSDGHNCGSGEFKCLHTCGGATQDKCKGGTSKGTRTMLTHAWGKNAQLAKKECSKQNGTPQY